jgi:protein involved in polysaccharide export with SLBB domain
MKMLKPVRRFLCSIWAVGVLAATANWAQNATTPTVTPNHPADQQTVSELYRIGIKDVLSITVWKEP